MIEDMKKEWIKVKKAVSSMAYPAEYLVRIFKGEYPRLNLSKESFHGKKICDVGCGGGRNLIFLKHCGFSIYGVEISDEMVSMAMNNLQEAGIDDGDIRTGANGKIPFEADMFDFLLSWNACYYMDSVRDFQLYVNEFARVLKKGGKLVLSIPMKSCFIYKGHKPLPSGFCVINNDPFKIRNGQVLRIFQDEIDIKEEFSSFFDNFTFGSVVDDCFGFNYHSYLTVCERK